MNKFQKGLVGIVLPIVATLSGCSGFTLGGYEPVNLSNSHYTEDIEKKADELAQSKNMNDMVGAMKGYGCTGNLNQMDELVKGIIRRDIEEGMDYSELGDKFHKMHGN